MEYRITYAVGRCRTATDGKGTRFHAVPGQGSNGGDWTRAICGYVPGFRGNGWSDYQGDAVNCPKCLAKLAKMGVQDGNG